MCVCGDSHTHDSAASSDHQRKVRCCNSLNSFLEQVVRDITVLCVCVFFKRDSERESVRASVKESEG